jgi:serine/threonine protein kinase
MRKVDVWAIGCVLYELCTGGKRLFQWQNEQEKYMQLAQLYSGCWSPPAFPPHVAGWQEVVDAMLTVDPALRPLPADVLKLGIFGCVQASTFCVDWWKTHFSNCTNCHGSLS